MTRLGDERGVALVAALGILLVLLPLGAIAVLHQHLQHLMARNARAAVEELYAAEARLARAVRSIPPGVGIGPLLAGPDGVAGSADDGTFPYGTGDALWAPAAAVTLAVSRATPAVARIEAMVGEGAARRVRVEALVARATDVFTPAAWHVEGDWWGELTPGDLRIEGADHRIGDAPGAPTGPAPPRPAVSASGEGGGAGTGVVRSPALGLAALAEDLMAHPAAVPLAGQPAERLACGTPESPQLTVVRGDLDVDAGLGGAGVLVVDGRLRVRSAFAFAGLVVARGGIVTEEGAAIDLLGALWSGPPLPGVMMRGAGHVAYSSEALARADAAAAGRLPRPAVVVGWRELF